MVAQLNDIISLNKSLTVNYTLGELFRLLPHYFKTNMNKIVSLLIFFFYMNTTLSQTFHDISIKGIDGETINLSDFKGQNLLIVNVASFCGYTSQYTELQELHDSYSNLTVIGVPCNQFGFQEPGNAKEIQTFCESKYSIEFVLTEKTKVKGNSKHPLYKWLTDKNLNGKDNYSISWNFNKFLVGKDGQLIAHYGSSVSPLDEKITSQLK